LWLSYVLATLIKSPLPLSLTLQPQLSSVLPRSSDVSLIDHISLYAVNFKPILNEQYLSTEESSSKPLSAVTEVSRIENGTCPPVDVLHHLRCDHHSGMGRATTALTECSGSSVHVSNAALPEPTSVPPSTR
jgi:hypothetical protein